MNSLIQPQQQQQVKNNNNNKIESGLDFILNHFDPNGRISLFPRTIMTKKLGYQKEVFSKKEAMQYFEESNYLDCRINTFPSYTEYKGIQRYPPNFIFIDLDKNNNDFKTLNDDLKLALFNTLKNIKEKLLNGFPTVLWSGNGYHIIQPVSCPKILVDGVLETAMLENITEFKKYDKPSQEFLRFVKDYLSNGKADKNNNPSFKSCLLRIPGSINSKNNVQVKIIQEWNGIRSPITKELMLDFKRYLIQKKIDLENKRHKMISERIKNNTHNINSSYYEWIEQLLLLQKTPIEDFRKLVVDLVLAPYLINIKKLSYSDSYQIIKDWLDKCNDLKRLDNYRNFVEYRIPYALKNAMNKQIGPMSREKIKTDSNYNELYQILKEKKVLL